MTKLVDEELENLKNKSDKELMTIYASQALGRFPSTVVIKAVGIVMAARNLQPGNMVIAFNYKDSTGAEKVLQLMEV